MDGRYNQEAEAKFYNRVGWTIKEQPRESLEIQIMGQLGGFKNNDALFMTNNPEKAPKGNLPTILRHNMAVRDERLIMIPEILSRAADCNL